MPPVIPGRSGGNGKPKGDEGLLEMLFEHWIKDIPILGDLYEMFDGTYSGGGVGGSIKDLFGGKWLNMDNIVTNLVTGYTGSAPATADPVELVAVGTSIQNRFEALEGGGALHTLTSSTTLDLSMYAPSTTLEIICISSSRYGPANNYSPGLGGFYVGQQIEVQDIIDKWGAPYLSAVNCCIGTLGNDTWFAANSLSTPTDSVVRTLNGNVVISSLGAAQCMNGGPAGAPGGAGHDSGSTYPIGGRKGSPGNKGSDSLLAEGSPGAPQGSDGGPGQNATVPGGDAPLDGLVKGAGAGGGSGSGGGVNSLGFGQNGGNGIAGGYPGGPAGGGGYPGTGPSATGDYGIHGARTNGAMFVRVLGG